ncbi:hypothetical protein J6590_060517 [Homalodisca vitripennis]|nr:hypothetical protein J6590_060517 [Homalodisca vitripennis]
MATSTIHKPLESRPAQPHLPINSDSEKFPHFCLYVFLIFNDPKPIVDSSQNVRTTESKLFNIRQHNNKQIILIVPLNTSLYPNNNHGARVIVHVEDVLWLISTTYCLTMDSVKEEKNAFPSTQKSFIEKNSRIVFGRVIYWKPRCRIIIIDTSAPRVWHVPLVIRAEAEEGADVCTRMEYEGSGEGGGEQDDEETPGLLTRASGHSNQSFLSARQRREENFIFQL